MERCKLRSAKNCTQVDTQRRKKELTKHFLSGLIKVRRFLLIPDYHMGVEQKKVSGQKQESTIHASIAR